MTDRGADQLPYSKEKIVVEKEPERGIWNRVIENLSFNQINEMFEEMTLFTERMFEFLSTKLNGFGDEDEAG